MIGRIIGLLRHPRASWRTFWVNRLRQNTVKNGGTLNIRPFTVVDIDDSARIEISGFCDFGFKKYRGSRLETSLWMAPGASFSVGRCEIYHGSDLQIFKDAHLKIGSKVIMNRGTQIICQDEICIGDDCLISRDVVIRDNDGGHRILVDGYKKTSPVRIGSHVWIGQGALILKGAQIGDGAVIGAGAVVTGRVKAGSLVMPDPSRTFAKDIEWARR